MEKKSHGIIHIISMQDTLDEQLSTIESVNDATPNDPGLVRAKLIIFDDYVPIYVRSCVITEEELEAYLANPMADIYNKE